MLSLLSSCVVVVFVAELIGDKTIYSLGTLASRYPARVIMAGVVPACCGKMLAAVLLGKSIAQLPGWLTAFISAITFFLAAVLLWKRKGKTAPPIQLSRHGHGAWTAFGTIFLTEWGDPGQLAAASLAARYDAPLIIWIGASVAMITKAILGITLGVGLRYYLPERTLRYAGAAVLVSLGLASGFAVWRS